MKLQSRAKLSAVSATKSDVPHVENYLLSKYFSRFAVGEGDLIAYLNVWEAWKGAGDGRPSWAHRHSLNHRTLLRVADIRSQLCWRLRCSIFPLKPCCKALTGPELMLWGFQRQHNRGFNTKKLISKLYNRTRACK